MKPTPEQQAIYDFVRNGTGNGMVKARAGTGKSHTITSCVSAKAKNISMDKSVCIVAFNKHIADEMNQRDLPQNVTARTLHSVGNGTLMGHKRMKLDAAKTLNIMKDVCEVNRMDWNEKKVFWAVYPAVKKIISLFKNFGYGIDGIRPDFKYAEAALKLSQRYDVELPSSPEGKRLFDFAIAAVWEASHKHHTMDFDDMLYLPLRLNLAFPKFDWVFVDESQDLNPIQIAMVEKMVRGRVLFVGDDKQAIYGFRGADPEAIKMISDKFNTTELPLTVCWRCPVNVIKEAQEIVPDIQWAEDAEDGIVRELNELQTGKRDFEALNSEIKAGDNVLCRTTAPLVELALQFLSRKRKASVMGRDIGENLIKLIEKTIAKGYGDMVQQFETYRDEEAAKLDGEENEAKLQSHTDKCDTVAVFMAGQKSWTDVIARINDVFSDKVEGILLSTVHRAKGLESNNVYVLRPDCMPHPMAKQAWQVEQEWNLKYVAITRARKQLVWVWGE